MSNKDHILQLIKNSVSATAPGATLILYGSYARGDYREDSDIDLLILVDRDKITSADERVITYPLYDIEFKTGTIKRAVITRNYLTRGTKAIMKISLIMMNKRS